MYSLSDRKEAIKRLDHILDFIEKGQRFLQGKSPDDLIKDEVLNLAMEKVLQNIGEASNAIASEIRNDYADIPWRKMINMRNLLAHGYDDVDAGIVWSTALNDLETLKPQIQKMLDDFKS